jgi:bifunctional NMN adenylyltransferase/nudix hydrolase
MRPKSTPAADCGVIVGRFHVATLHEGHKALIDYVAGRHSKVVIFLGLAPARVTRNNPLDFEARKQMILADYPDITVLYIRDVHSDELWSKELDKQISDVVGPASTVMLYGSRESFIAHYTGKRQTCELEQDAFISGTDVRKKISARVKASPDFREGVIWAAYNQYPKVYPTVDVAIWDEDEKKLLMARKPTETLFRFIGGFVDPNESLEQAARREAGEEGHIEVSDPVYVGSSPVDDWRYRRELDCITTAFFEVNRVFGKPEPDDDIEELRWFDAATIRKEDLVSNHGMLLDMLVAKWPERFRQKKVVK